MTSTLHVQLFDSFRLTLDEAVFTLPSERLQSLLVYLLLHRRAPQPRLHLAFLLWPDSSESQARTNLRNLLHQLRRHLPDVEQFVAVESTSLQWREDGPYTLDVAEFEAALSRARKAETQERRREALERAVELYQGDLLPASYEEWLLPAREELRQGFLKAVEELILHLEAAGDFRAAIRHAQRLVQHEPLQEASYALLMRLHASSGDRAGVQRAYQQCVAALERELGVEPSRATQETYKQLVQLEAGAGPAESLPPLPQPVPQTSRGPSPIRLPVQATAFVGRQEELTRLASLLNVPECRLITLVGPGGIGKSRLAIQAAGQQGGFADGVFFVPLAPVASSDLLVSAIANAIGFVFSGAADSKTQLLNFLREKQMLLVLDNFEHLLEGAELVADLLQESPQVKLVVTSRERLNLHSEWLFEVDGLPVPEAAQGTLAMEANDAVALFVQTARRVRPGYALAEAERSSVARVCQLVGGMPLGIELAAAWARMLPVAEITREIERNLDFLSTSTRDVPPRHRSVRAALDHSWNLLPKQERTVLARLSVFQGGFSRDAAAQVADASLAALSALVDKSLLRRTEIGQYDLHELVRQYVAAKLQEQPQDHANVQALHSHYYLHLLHERQAALEGEGQLEAVAELEAVLDNLRLAWKWATDHLDVADLNRAARSLARLHHLKGWFEEGQGLFQYTATALERAQPAEEAAGETFAALGKVLMYQAHYYHFLQDEQGEGQALLTRSVELLRQSNDAAAFAEAHLHLGVMASKAGAYAEADTHFHTSLGPAQTHKDEYVITLDLMMLGLGAYYRGRYEESLALFHQSIALCRARGDRFVTSVVLNFYSVAAYASGQYTEAEAGLRESIAISETFKNRWTIGGAYNYLGLVKLAQDETAEAEALFGRGLALFREVGDPWFTAHTLNNLGDLFLLQRRLDEAQSVFYEALQLAMGQQAHRLVADALVGWGGVLAQKGSAAQAWELGALVRDYPASSEQAHGHARALFTRLEAHLSPQEVADAEVRAQNRSLESVAAETLAAGY